MRVVQRMSLFAVLPTAAILAIAASSGPAAAAPAAVGLGTSTSFAVLAGQAVTNTGPSVISGDLGVSPGTAVTGFPPGTLNNGVQHTDAVALQAQNDVTTAYNDAAGRPFTVDETGVDLGNQLLVAGVYRDTSAMGLTGTVTLDAQGDPDAVFVFQAGSTLITGSNSAVLLANGAQACNVFWQVGSSATLGAGTAFVGTVLALTSITVQTGATVQGRLLARNGQVSLDNNVITRSSCATPAVPPTVTSVPTTPTKPSGDKSTKKSADKSNDKGGDKSMKKSDDKSDKGGDKSTKESADKSTDKGGDTSSTTTSSTTTTGTGTPTPSVTTPIPGGHPETGRPGYEGGGDSGVWLLGAGGCALGAAGAATVSTGSRRRRSARSS